jgi:hypothetical protein
VTLTIEDIGGEAALRDTLKDFYRRALAALPGRRVRKAVRRLCENFLISPEGRRLSLEENEIKRQLRLSSETLRHLVSTRLLRCDSRADSMYYELSHDALIEPVLATRQARGLLLGSLGLVAGGISWLVTLGLLSSASPCSSGQSSRRILSFLAWIHRQPGQKIAILNGQLLWLYS